MTTIVQSNPGASSSLGTAKREIDKMGQANGKAIPNVRASQELPPLDSNRCTSCLSATGNCIGKSLYAIGLVVFGVLVVALGAGWMGGCGYLAYLAIIHVVVPAFAYSWEAGLISLLLPAVLVVFAFMPLGAFGGEQMNKPLWK